ncbi:SusC/RagA family TonB-linked outer membrane protein [Sediminibacterium ginsengisoli]|uniref:TonB-linked outer membrane protein, SusC/RagA family n=1 Tax=Sediminibacterium ginsengisoli TaxID=413434 RepID=A0A1T4LHG0_9BACT|nr:SusC/RagA family TonB-linked outer membrane protein [Sediminibacterium ginsengisoli]SJZ54120.1 TonB-linked outer membrane protein, SusC/RagA family [Sediminibacterium ginsengisoli]
MRRLALFLQAIMLLLLFSPPVASWAQTPGTVSGTVLADEDGSPLVGVTVTNRETKKATQTNQAGYYSIAAEKGQTLVFNYVSYTAKEVVVGDNRSISIRLVSGDKDLGNVVVTGYGQSREKRSLAYQAPVVKGEEIAQTRRDNFLNALAGRVPGLTVTSTSGLPGASATVMLRGGTSVGGNNQPLFVVDGVPMNNGSVNQEDLVSASSSAVAGAASLSLANRNSDYTNGIAGLNPEDIDNVTVLKGPEATSIYGSDGAGGAIVITTKKGTSGRTRITYTNSFSFSQVYRFPEIQTTYSRGANGAYDPSSYGSYGYIFFGPKYPEGTKHYDNMRNFFQNAFTQQHNITMEAGSNDLNYRFSGGYLDNGGVVPNTSLKRINLRFTAFAKMAKNITLSTTWSYINSNNQKATKGAGSFYTNLITYPTDIDASVYQNPDGTRKTIRNVALSSELNSPFWDVYKNVSQDKKDDFSGNLNLTATIAKGLTATTIIGINQATTQGLMAYHPQSSQAFSLGGYLSTYQNIFRSVNGTARLNYRKIVANKFSNDFYLGAYLENNNTYLTAQRGEKFFEADFISINNTDPVSRTARLTQIGTRKVRFFGGYTFGYNNLLYVTLSGTREGTSTLTSKFADLQPFFNYGSASASFIFSDLGFMKGTKSWLSLGKLRASYATTGKGPASAYVIDYPFNSVTSTGGGFQLGVTGNNFNLKPEFSKNLEIGGEFKFFKNRLGLDIAYFNNRVKDNIYAQRISYATGAILKYLNGGSLSARGWEIQITGKPIETKNFSWNTTINFDRARTIVETLPGDVPFYYDSDTWVFGNARSQVGPGQSLATLSGYSFQKNKNGQLLISPTTGLPIQQISSFDVIGDRAPDFKIGFINSFSYKNWFLNFNLDLRKGGDVFNAMQMMMTINGVSARTMDREQPRVITGVLQDGLENTDNPTPNNIAITPYFRSNYYNGVFAESDYIEKVNWLRMRDMTVGYELSQKLLKRQKVVKSASIYVTVTDVFMITNYSGMDPNVNALNSSNARGYGGAGIDWGAIPSPRTFNFGLKLSF